MATVEVVTRGPKGLTAAEQAYLAGKIEEPTEAALDGYLRAPAIEASDALDQHVAEKDAQIDAAIADTNASADNADAKAAYATQQGDYAKAQALAIGDISASVTAAQTARTDAEAARDLAVANAQLPANNAFPNLCIDPELEYLAIGDIQAWTGGSLTVVSSAGAKRFRTPASAAPIHVIDAQARRVEVVGLPNGRVSASIIISRKDATPVGGLRMRLLAFDAGGTVIPWPDVSTSDYPADPTYFSRNVPAAAITGPTELLVAQNVPIPATAVRIGWSIRVETTGTMDLSHQTIRNGADPHYRTAPVSPKAVADALTSASSALTAATSAQTTANAITATAAIGSANANANLYPDAELEYYTVGDSVTWLNGSFAVVSSGGAKRQRTVAVGSPIGVQDAIARRVPASAFPSGFVSASAIVSRKDLQTAATDLRFRLYAYDAGGAQLAWSTATGSDEPGNTFYGRYLPLAAITTPTEIVVARGVPLPAGTATIGWGVRVDGTPTMDFGQLTLRDGTDPHYQPPRFSPKAAADLATTVAAIGASPGLIEDFADIAAAFPNRFLATELDVQSMRYASGNANLLTASTYGADQRPVWAVTAPIAASAEFGVFFGAIPRADLVSANGKFSMAIQIYDFAAYVGSQGAGSQTARLLVIQRDNTGTEIAGTRVSKTITNPTTSPTWYREAGITLHASTTTVLLYIGVNNVGGTVTRSLKFGEMMLAAGSSTVFRRPAAAVVSSGGAGTVYVGPAGSDVAAGTSGAPLATAQAAINKLGGAGTIVFLAGSYTDTQRIDPTTITGRVTIVGKRVGQWTGYDTFPKINLGVRVTGLTKTAGRTKVYEATVAGLPTLDSFNWAYQDGVADPRTLIAAGDRSPQHRGRSYRMPWATKLVKTTATTLAAALTEIDAAAVDNPLAFIDDSTGKFYCSIVGGGDASAANIYLDAATGLFTTANRESCGELVMMNMEIRYGGLDVTPFRRAHFDEVFVFGAANNCISYSVVTYGTLECAASGSQGGLIGDGLNGHIGAKIISGLDYYGHDCRDDGYSDHEGASARMHGGLLEFNGGTGAAPAYGADDVLVNFVSRKNQQRGMYKRAGFYVTGAPTSGGGGGDGGVDTLAVFLNCISIGDIIGFADDRNTTSGAVRAVTIGCRVFDQTGSYGYDVAEMRDCGWVSATGVARNTGGGATTVRNTALVS